MHVPLIASWPGKVRPGAVCGDLVDTTDFLPTLLEAAGQPLASGPESDGRSFLPQLRGERGQPREWIYYWYCPRPDSDPTVHEFAFDQHFKLYRTGRFFDLARDPAEKHPLDPATLSGEAAAATKRLHGVLEMFKDARPPRLEPAVERGRKRAGKGKPRVARNEPPCGSGR
jgi:arylsulfatase A